MNILKRYSRWLHTQWPAGEVEKLPVVREDGSTSVPGLYITGDLRGVPLLKFSADSGARVVRTIAEHLDTGQAGRERGDTTLDLVIVGAGVSGMAAALEAKKKHLRYEICEATEPFSTIVNFPKGKPIYTYPREMKPEGDLQFEATVKEDLVDELRSQTLESGIHPRMSRVTSLVRRGNRFQIGISEGDDLVARCVIVAIGRSGNFRKLNVAGEDRDRVYNRLHDPGDFDGMDVLVVGGGDSALETAIATVQSGAHVTLSYRRNEFSRPKPENLENLQKLIDDPGADVAVETPVSERVNTSSGGFMKSRQHAGSVRLLLGTEVTAIRERAVELRDQVGEKLEIENDVVFSMIGREAPLGFLRKAGVRITGDMTWKRWTFLGIFVLSCFLLYNWKSDGTIHQVFRDHQWFPYNVSAAVSAIGGSLGESLNDRSTLPGTVAVSLSDPGFYYSVAYTVLVISFGIARIRRRRTPYITAQTSALMFFQTLPLFLLPYIILPFMGNNGVFDHGVGKTIADNLFPAVNYGQGREYWRAFGLILAWPLFIWNVFTSQPLWWWLAISLAQTFVVIPLIIYFWGKGAYCGWVCSCGALAETLGDMHREKMPHGAVWNRVNMVGQVILLVALILLALRVLSWMLPDTAVGRGISTLYAGMLRSWSVGGVQLNYKWTVDLFLAGVVGYGAYFWFSGRVWCRFACPLAALMHIYARFSRFRIIPEKKKCITCNVCTSVCHQGIDIMNFANKGIPMADPECVRCSACVYSCPTGVLQFGQVNRASGETLRLDRLAASPVLMREE